VKVFVFIIICISTISLNISGQKFYRINGEFTIKAKSADGKNQLTMGKFYYDKSIQKLVYINNFPIEETWVLIDTNIYRIVDNKLTDRFLSPSINLFSIFHLALTSEINNYGLKNSPFTISKVEKQNDMVITTWLPPANLTKIAGKVLVSNKSNKLFGIVFMDTKGKIIKKQFFENYQNVSGVEFPMEITDITYTGDKENYQVTTYKNVVIDEPTKNMYFDFPIPAN
jgi:hypothetical protein